MAINVYIVPQIIVQGPRGDRPQGKYMDELLAGGVQVSQLFYGREEVVMLMARDVPLGIHQTMAGHADCTTVPDLSQTVGSQLIPVQTSLEALNVPSGWVTEATGYASLVRTVASLFLIFERLTSITPERLFGTVTLDTRWNQLPAAVRQQLLDVASSFNFSTAGMSGSTTVRQILKALWDQWPQLSIPFGEVTL